MAVDCSTFSSFLLESELFGHVKGAFTGAVKDKAGIFDVAKHGIPCPDEVANLNLDIQANPQWATGIVVKKIFAAFSELFFESNAKEETMGQQKTWQKRVPD